MARKKIIGIMGPGKTATPQVKKLAFELGQLAALEGWLVLTGGVNRGVMDAGVRGAKSVGGTTIGIISRRSANISRAIDIAIMTDMGRARNNLNVMTSDALVICGMGDGTASEVAFAIQDKKPIIFIQPDTLTWSFFRKLGGSLVHSTRTPAQCLRRLKKLMPIK